MTVPEADPIGHTELQVADTIGRLIEFWGFKRAMGRAWTLLYLSPSPSERPSWPSVEDEPGSGEPDAG